MLGHYASADLVLGMRFHANVCPMALSTPTVGLNCYVQIENLYRELNLEDRAIFVGNPCFKEMTLERVNELISHEKQDSALIAALSGVKEQRALFQPVLHAWLSKFI